MTRSNYGLNGTDSITTTCTYDVVRLFEMPEIQMLLDNKEELKRIVVLTKDTDSYYLEKRDVSKEYNPKGEYDFESWRRYFERCWNRV